MFDLWIVGLILLCVLTIVTVVGHGIWVLLAKIFGSGGAKSPQSDPTAARSHCPRCELPWTRLAQCPGCGWPAAQVVPTQRITKLFGLQLQLKRYGERGTVPPDVLARLERIVNDEIAAARAARPGTPATPAATAPSAAPVVPPPSSVPRAARVPDFAAEVTGSSAPPSDAPPMDTRLPGDVATVERLVGQRAAAYQAARPQPTPQPAAPRPPSVPWSAWLAGFLEERNIRWGELIGGLLIVGSSIALVLSFWGEIAERAWLKFGLFHGVAAALFGAGYYMHRHWKLTHASRAVLLVATLLVPLNCLAIAALARSDTQGLAAAAGEVGSLAVFAGLVWFAAGVIATDTRAALTLGVMTSAGLVFVIRRLAGPDLDPGVFWALGLGPGAACAAANLLPTVRDQARSDYLADTLGRRFTLLGATTFATGLALGLLASLTEVLERQPARFAPLVPLVGWAAVSVGLVGWRRMEGESRSTWGLAALAVALLGGTIQIVALVLAWPDPGMLVAIALVAAGVMTWGAVQFRLPWGHAGAAAALAVAYFVAAAVVRGDVGWGEVDGRALVGALASAPSGTSLAPLAAVLGLGAYVWRRRGRATEALGYGAVAGVAAAVSLALVSWKGLGRADDGYATWLYAVYGVGAVVAAQETRRPEFVWTAAVLGLLALVQGIAFRYAAWLGWEHPWLAAVLAHAALGTLGGVVARRWAAWPRELLGPLHWAASATSLAAAVLLGGAALRAETAFELALYPWCFAVVWGVGAWARVDRAWFTALQAAVAAGCVLLVAAGLERNSWFQTSSLGWLDPWCLQAFGLALLAYSAAWVGARVAVRRRGAALRRTSTLLLDDPVGLDQWLALGVLIVTGCLAWWAVLPGVDAELSGGPRGVPAIAWPTASRHAAGAAAWALVIAGWIRWGLSRFDTPWTRWPVATTALVWLACPLAAAEATGRVGSALAWALAMFLLAGAAVLVALRRWRLGTLSTARFAGWPQFWGDRATLERQGLVALTAPLVAGLLVMLPVSPSVASPWDVFLAHLAPGALVAAALVVLAMGERREAEALWAGLTLTGIVVLSHLHFAASPAGRSRIDVDAAFRLAQGLGIVGGGYALAWLAWLWAVQRRRRARWLWVQVWLAVLGPLRCSWVAAVDLWPGVELRLDLWAVDLRGWASVGLASAAVLGSTWALTRRRPIYELAGVLLALGPMLGLTWQESFASDRGGLLVWQAWLAGSAALLIVLGLRGWRAERQAVAFALTAVWVAMVLWSPSTASGQTAAWLTVAAGLAALLAAWRRARWRIVAAALLLAVAAPFAWRAAGLPRHEAVLWSVLVALALPCPVWRWIHAVWIAPGHPPRDRFAWHRLVPDLALVGLALGLGVAYFVPRPYAAFVDRPWWPWFAVLSILGALVVNFWDRAAWPSGPRVYLLGLASIGVALVQLPFDDVRWVQWAAASLVAAFTLAASYLWSRRGVWLEELARWGVPVPRSDARHDLVWLVPANGLLIAGLVAGAFAFDFHVDALWMRLAVAKAALLQTVSLALLAQGAPRSYLQRAALAVAIVAAVAWAWAWLTPAAPLLAVERWVLALTVFCVAAVGLGLGVAKLARRDSDWARAAQELSLILCGLLALGACAVLALEARQYAQLGELRVALWARQTLAGMLGLLAAAGFVAALVPGRDPLGLSERGRTGYVYAAEAALAMLGLHARLAFPALFRGWFDAYWPLVIMGLAFVSVGLSEAFRRQRRLVLYEPLERTGVLLPLAPVVGYWMTSPDLHYAGVMIAAGTVYSALAVLRRSFGYSLLAALAANVGLWSFLHDVRGYSFLEQPQFWLIPPALCVLAAAHLQRRVIPPAQLTTVRYAAGSVVYLAATADVFLRGVAQAPLLPLVLGAWSLAGVLAGIMLRVRAFLYLGTTFLIVALATVIKYAAIDRNQGWVWAATGIVVGVLMMAAFALFERRRDDVLRVVAELRRWER